LDRALRLLQPVKESFGESLSWADLIVLAGTTALEEAGGRTMRFCGGRTDATEAVAAGASLAGSADYLKPRVAPDGTSVELLKDSMQVSGLSLRESVALIGGGHSLGKMHVDRSGFKGHWTEDPTRLSNSYFQNLLNEQWEEIVVPESGKKQFKASGKELYMLKSDMLLRADGELAAIVQDYATDEGRFLNDFALAWTKLVNADRFKGPASSVCDAADARSDTVADSQFYV
jgi:catalase (peroxidase I)